MPEPLDIYGHAELASVLGVSRQRVDQLRRRDDFPKPAPIATRPEGLLCGPIWHGPEVRQYAATRLQAPAGRAT